jgi:hypothetical protein
MPPLSTDLPADLSHCGCEAEVAPRNVYTNCKISRCSRSASLFALTFDRKAGALVERSTFLPSPINLREAIMQLSSLRLAPVAF